MTAQHARQADGAGGEIRAALARLVAAEQPVQRLAPAGRRGTRRPRFLRPPSEQDDHERRQRHQRRRRRRAGPDCSRNRDIAFPAMRTLPLQFFRRVDVHAWRGCCKSSARSPGRWRLRRRPCTITNRANTWPSTSKAGLKRAKATKLMFAPFSTSSTPISTPMALRLTAMQTTPQTKSNAPSQKVGDQRLDHAARPPAGVWRGPGRPRRSARPAGERRRFRTAAGKRPACAAQAGGASPGI